MNCRNNFTPQSRNPSLNANFAIIFHTRASPPTFNSLALNRAKEALQGLFGPVNRAFRALFYLVRLVLRTLYLSWLASNIHNIKAYSLYIVGGCGRAGVENCRKMRGQSRIPSCLPKIVPECCGL